MRIPVFLKRAWKGFKCRNGHDWFEHVDYTMRYNLLDAPVRHRTCQVCGKSEIAIPFSPISDPDTGLIDGVWVPRDLAIKEMHDPNRGIDKYFAY